MAEETSCFIPTRGSAFRNTAVPYKEVVFSAPTKKRNFENPIGNSHKSNERQENNEIDMKKARYEILKFARSNVKSSTRQKTARELALELGAKPPKRKPIDYKLLLAKKKRNKDRKERKEAIKKLTQRFNGKSIIKNYKKKNVNPKRSSGILDIYGKAKQNTGIN